MADISPTSVWQMLREAGSDWLEDNAPQQGAALSFYSILSLAPLLVISLAVTSLAFSHDAARAEMIGQLQGVVGEEGAEAAKTMLDNAQQPQQGIVATVLGVITLLFGASGVFGQLQESLNSIWDVKPKPGGGIWALLRARFLSLGMVLGTAFLLLISLVLSAVIAGVGTTLQNQWPGMETLWQIVNVVISFGVATLLFALIFKYLPDAIIAWRDVWVGAVLTALLFTVGKWLIGMYLGKSGLSSAYGAAGSFVVLVVWIYYSALILFFGAELTQVYARRYGARITPKPGAEYIGDQANAPSPAAVPASGR